MRKCKHPIEIAFHNIKCSTFILNEEYRFISTDFAYVYNFARLGSSIPFMSGASYRLRERRIMYVLTGNATISVNLISYHLTPHSLLYISANSLIEVIDYSHDLDLKFILLCDEFINSVINKSILEPQVGEKFCIFLPSSEQLEQITEPFFILLEKILHIEPFRKEVVQHLIISFLYNIKYIAQEQRQHTECNQSTQEVIFRKFITLVNIHFIKERNVSFYANKLCLTPRYLNTVIRKASQQTVMDWINQAVLLEAKVCIKQNDLSITEISDHLNFANPSFFCKFFKRHTGMTPLQYKKSS